MSAPNSPAKNRAPGAAEVGALARMHRRSSDLLWFGIGVAFLILLNVLPLGERAGMLLLDKHDGHFQIISVHNLIWVAFFVGLGRLITRYRAACAEELELRENYLPAESDEILTSADLGEIYQRLRTSPRHRFLPRLLQRTVTQYQGNKSISHAHTLLDSCLDLYLHELDLGYHMIRYMVWLIPTLGFIGSVIGIGRALAVAGAANPEDPQLLSMTTSAMAIAFNGTFLALTLSALLVFIMHIAQSKEERALNASAQYCLDRLINRLYEGERA